MSLHASVSHAVGYASSSLSFQLADDQTLVHVNGSTLAFQNLETFHHDVLVPSTSPHPIVAFDINWTTSTLALTARERHAVIAIYSYPEKKLKGHLKASRLDVVVEYTCLKFSHCGRRLLSLCPVSEETFQVAFWDLKTFSLLQSVSIALSSLSFASFDPQNWNQIVLGGDTRLHFVTFYHVNATNLLRITSVAKHSPVSNPTSVDNEPLSCHTWLDSHRVVVATSTGAFHLVETTKAHVVTKSIQPALPSIPASIIDLLVVSPHLLVAYTNGTLAWLQLDTWHLVHLITLPGFHLPSSPSLVTVLKPTPSHSKAFIGTSDGQLVELSTSLYPSENTDNDKEDEQQTRRILHPLVSFHSGPLCATTVLTPFQGTFSINAMVATGALNGVFTLSGLSNGLETARFHITSIFHDEPVLRSSITALAASPGDPFLVLGDAQGRVRALSVLKIDSDNVHVKPLYSFQLMPLKTPLDLLGMHPLQPLVLVASTQSHHVFLVSLHPDDRHAPILAFFTFSDHTERVWAIQWQESTDMTLKWTSLSSHGVLYTAEFHLPEVKGLEKTVELKPHPIATSENPLVPCLQVSFLSPRVLIGTSPNASDLFLLTFSPSSSPSPSLPLETSSLHSKSLVQRAHSRGISAFTLFSLENNIQLLVIGGMDGVLTFWTLESSSNFDSNLDDQIQATKHQTLPLHTQAITCLDVLPALQNSSLQVLSTSVDGSIFLLNIHLPSSKFSISTSSSLAPVSNVLYAPFFSLNPTPFQAHTEPFLDTKARLETSTQLDKIDPQTQHVRNQLETLQRQLDALIVANQELPLEDQVPRDDLVINLAWKDAFTRQTSAKIESIRHESTRKLARLAILRDRLKRDFYDPLAVPPSRLYAFPPLLSSLSSSNQLAFVSNFPLPRPTTSDQKLAKQLHLLRSIELAYHQTQPQNKRQQRIRIPLNLPWLLNTQNEDNMTPSFPLLYPPAALLTRRQVRLQVHFLQAYTRSLAQAFNVEFEAVKELKATIFDQLEANQRRIQELTNNVDIEARLWPTSWQLEEQVDGIFKVQAMELIHNKPYETVAERVRREQEAQAAELESHSRRNEDVRQRALQDMMNGTIEGTKAPRSRVEQQGHDVDVEVQGLRADQVDWMRAFNDKLRGLEERYRATKRAVGAQELYVLCFGEKLMIEEALRYDEEELEASKRAIDALQAQAQDESTFLKAQVEIGRTHVQRALERDTQVDKSVVKELEKMSQSIQETTGVSEGFALLLELYRQRGNGSETSRSDLKRPLKGTSKQRLVTESHTRKDQRRQPTVSTRTSSTSLEMPLERPKGLFLDEEQWHSFLALRRKKLHSEHVFNEKTTALAALKRLSDESSTIVLEIQRQGQELGLENEKRIQNRERTWHGTVPLLVSLKQGQDETLEDVIERREALKDRWLVPRTSVEALNGEIQRHGAFQLTLLERIKTFRKRLNLFEWEHMKLELERRDRDEEYTDLHLLRVTKDVQELLKTGDTSHQQKRQVAALEATLMQLRRQYALQMEQVERKETIWRRQLHDRERERETYQEQVTELERNVAIRQEVVVRRAKKEMNRKKQDIKHKSWRVRRRLIDVIKVQTKDIEALRREMDTMRARTYPRFIQEEKLPVDLKQ